MKLGQGIAPSPDRGPPDDGPDYASIDPLDLSTDDRWEWVRNVSDAELRSTCVAMMERVDELQIALKRRQ